MKIIKVVCKNDQFEGKTFGDVFVGKTDNEDVQFSWASPSNYVDRTKAEKFLQDLQMALKYSETLKK